MKVERRKSNERKEDKDKMIVGTEKNVKGKN